MHAYVHVSSSSLQARSAVCGKGDLLLLLFPFQSAQISVCWPNTTHLSLSWSAPLGSVSWEKSEGSYDRDNERTVHGGFGQRKEGNLKSLLEGANEQRERRERKPGSG